jgi:hypothetical protein
MTRGDFATFIAALVSTFMVGVAAGAALIRMIEKCS